MKKIAYSIVLLLLLSISAWLIYYRTASSIGVREATNTQTAISNDVSSAANGMQSAYNWNEKMNTAPVYTKKVEQLSLYELQNGNSDYFKLFLAGLWYQPSSKENKKTSIFFDTNENNIIFSIDNIEEIFTITAITEKRYGILFSAHNTSISSIKRRVDIELIDVDEITVRVIDNVAGLKIGTASNWDGLYRKMNNITQSKPNTVQQITGIKKILADHTTIWKTTDGYTLSFSGSVYTFEHDNYIEQGWYTLFTIKDMIIMQWKNNAKKNTFFAITLDISPEKKRQLNLTEVAITLNENIRMSNAQLLFEQQHKEG